MPNHSKAKLAEDIQQDIFCAMSADEKLAMAAKLWLLAKALDSDKIDFRIHGRNRPSPPSDTSRRDS